jgi:hypothetical protein
VGVWGVFGCGEWEHMEPVGGGMGVGGSILYEFGGHGLHFDAKING